MASIAANNITFLIFHASFASVAFTVLLWLLARSYTPPRFLVAHHHGNDFTQHSLRRITQIAIFPNFFAKHEIGRSPERECV